MERHGYTIDQLRNEYAFVLANLVEILGEQVGMPAALGAVHVDEAAWHAEHHAAIDVTHLPGWHLIQEIDAYVRLQRGRPFLEDAIAATEALLRRGLSTDTPYPFEKLHLPTLIDEARARLTLDNGEPLTLGQVGILVGQTENSVQKAAARSDFEVIVDVLGRRLVEADEILAWLPKRGYLETQDPATYIEAEEDKVEYVLVPVAADGSWFSPSCRMSRGFSIGPKGGEQKVSDYWKALDILRTKALPHWRRPASDGTFGIVSGRGWQSVPRALVDRQLKSKGD